jgi:Transposase
MLGLSVRAGRTDRFPTVRQDQAQSLFRLDLVDDEVAATAFFAEGRRHPQYLAPVQRHSQRSLDAVMGPALQLKRKAGLIDAGFETTLMETRHVKAALSAMTVKTDRRDARGMAHLIRMGWFRPVHAKSPGSQELRALLVARKQLQHKLIDIELSIRGILRGFGLKVGHVTTKTFEERIRKLVTGHATLSSLPRPCWWQGQRC